MFQVGETVVYGTTGVCTIVSCGPLSMHGVDRKRQYFTLQPLYQEGAVYVPAEGDKLKAMRYPMNREEAQAFLSGIAGIAACPIEQFNYKQRTDMFTAALHENNCASLVAVIKAVEEKKRRFREKQQYNADNSFHKRAMNLLCGELAYALGITVEESRGQVEQAVRQETAVEI